MTTRWLPSSFPCNLLFFLPELVQFKHGKRLHVSNQFCEKFMSYHNHSVYHNQTWVVVAPCYLPFIGGIQGHMYSLKVTAGYPKFKLVKLMNLYETWYLGISNYEHWFEGHSKVIRGHLKVKDVKSD